MAKKITYRKYRRYGNAVRRLKAIKADYPRLDLYVTADPRDPFYYWVVAFMSGTEEILCE